MALLKKSKRVYGSGTNRQTRYFLSKWYKSFPWLHFCSSKYQALCFYCMKAARLNVSVMSSKEKAAFISTGFSNWRKATVQFKEHELSLAHHDGIDAHQSSQSASVSSLISSEMRRNQVHSRNSLIKQITALKFLLSQGLAIWNDLSGGSNLTIMLEMVLNEMSWVATKKY